MISPDLFTEKNEDKFKGKIISKLMKYEAFGRARLEENILHKH